MSLYCLNCKKIIEVTNKKCKCNTSDLVSVTTNMIPIATILDRLGLPISSVFCITEKHEESTSVQAEVYFKHIYPEELFQELPTNWYWTDYLTLEQQVLCSCLSSESKYINNDDVSLEQFVDGVINSLVRYLETRNKDGLQSVLTLLQS